MRHFCTGSARACVSHVLEVPVFRRRQRPHLLRLVRIGASPLCKQVPFELRGSALIKPTRWGYENIPVIHQEQVLHSIQAQERALATQRLIQPTAVKPYRALPRSYFVAPLAFGAFVIFGGLAVLAVAGHRDEADRQYARERPFHGYDPTVVGATMHPKYWRRDEAPAPRQRNTS